MLTIYLSIKTPYEKHILLNILSYFHVILQMLSLFKLCDKMGYFTSKLCDHFDNIPCYLVSNQMPNECQISIVY